jgi:hypothetical protein
MLMFVIAIWYFPSPQVEDKEADLAEALTDEERQTTFLERISKHTAVHRIMQCQFNPDKCDIIVKNDIIYVYSDFIGKSIFLPERHHVDKQLIILNYRCPPSKRRKKRVCAGT